jgi:hypothetical protein
MLKRNIGFATLLLIAGLAGCQHASEVANEPQTPEAQCAKTAHLQYDRLQEDVRRQTRNPSYKFSFTSHYANKLGQCLIVTESPYDTQDSSWHGMRSRCWAPPASSLLHLARETVKSHRRVVLFIQEELGVGSKRMQAWSANLKKSSTLSRKLYWSSRRCSMCAGLKTAFRCARLSTRICSFRISILAKPELRSRMNVAEL